MLENSLIKILTSICFCEERGKGGGRKGRGGMEDGGWEGGLMEFFSLESPAKSSVCDSK
jgi:hypothetical protein